MGQQNWLSYKQISTRSPAKMQNYISFLAPLQKLNKLPCAKRLHDLYIPLS